MRGTSECTMFYGAASASTAAAAVGNFPHHLSPVHRAGGRGRGRTPDWTSRFVLRGRLGVNELIVMMKPNAATTGERENSKAHLTLREECYCSKLFVGR